MNSLTGTASTDLGLGSSLSQQVKDDTEDEERRRKLGLSPLQNGAAQALGFGMTGVAPVKLS